MARKATGQVLERKRKTATVFALRFRAYGQRQYLTLGSTADGWSRPRAEEELENVLADVRRGIWQPPAPEPDAGAPAVEPTFHEFATDWFEARRPELRPNTIAAYEYELTHHLLPFFAGHRLSEITIAEVDRYRAAKVREREVGGRRLSNEMINKTLTRLAQILEVAVEYGHLDRNPAAGKRRRLKVSRPQRSYLDRAEQIAALLAGAEDLDRDGRGGNWRRPLLATLVFAGLRIGELCALRWRDVDLAGGRMRVGQSKTDAGVRDVELLPALRDELLALRVVAPDDPDAFVFGTSTGGCQNPSNVRTRTLARSIEKANARLEADELAPLPERITPHSLRRTFASLLFALGRSAPDVMEQLGHTDPKLTLRVYARAMRRDRDDAAALRSLAGIDGNVAGRAPIRGSALQRPAPGRPAGVTV